MGQENVVRQDITLVQLPRHPISKSYLIRNTQGDRSHESSPDDITTCFDDEYPENPICSDGGISCSPDQSIVRHNPGLYALYPALELGLRMVR